MLIQPVEDIIPRRINDPEFEQRLGAAATAVEEIVNLGSWVLKWGADVTTGGDEKAPMFGMLRHFLELLDGIPILIRPSSAENAKLILRGLLESSFGLEYLLEADTDERGLAFMFWHFSRKLKIYKNHDPSTQQGRDHLQKMACDPLTRGMGTDLIPDVPGKIARVEGILARPEYDRVRAVDEDLRKKDPHNPTKKVHKNPAWYTLCDPSIDNVEKLAAHLGHTGQYELLYRGYSGPTDGTDIFDRKVSSGDQGGSAMLQLRSPKYAMFVTQQAVFFADRTYRLFIMLPEN